MENKKTELIKYYKEMFETAKEQNERIDTFYKSLKDDFKIESAIKRYRILQDIIEEGTCIIEEEYKDGFGLTYKEARYKAIELTKKGLSEEKEIEYGFMFDPDIAFFDIPVDKEKRKHIKEIFRGEEDVPVISMVKKDSKGTFHTHPELERKFGITTFPCFSPSDIENDMGRYIIVAGVYPNEVPQFIHMDLRFIGEGGRQIREYLPLAKRHKEDESDEIEKEVLYEMNGGVFSGEFDKNELWNI